MKSLFNSFRFQLTAWYLVFMTALLAGLAVTVYVLVSRSLRAQFDTSLAKDATTVAGVLAEEFQEGGTEVATAARDVLSEVRFEDTGVAVFQGDRRIAATGPVWADDAVTGSGEPRSPTPRFRTVARPGAAGIRVVTVAAGNDRNGIQVLAARPLDPVALQLQTLRRIFYLALSVTILVAGVGAFWLATRSLAPLVCMSQQAEEITHRNVHHQRLEVGRANNEIQSLVLSFNSLLERLSRSMETMHAFIADASHELRTPLAVVRGQSEVALTRERSPKEYQEVLQTIHQAARRLTHLVDSLLNLSRADTGDYRLQVSRFYLNELLADCCRSVEALAAGKDIRLSYSAADELSFCGDADLIRRLITNLLDNALRYTPPGGQVAASVEDGDGQVRITIADTGIGIGSDDLPRIFERFYRVDKARSSKDGGFGLGLSIVKWIAEAHAGGVTVESTAGAGSTFTAVLPRRQYPETATC